MRVGLTRWQMQYRLIGGAWRLGPSAEPQVRGARTPRTQARAKDALSWGHEAAECGAELKVSSGSFKSRASGSWRRNP